MPRTKRSKGVDLIQRAGAASSEGLAETVSSTAWQSGNDFYYTKVYHSNELDDDDKRWIGECYDANMRTLSENSSMGWKPEEKRDELFHRDSRFLLVRRTGQEGNWHELVAFSMFRFDWEDCVDEDILERSHGGREDQCEVLYLYELQVSSVARRNGIGAKLVRLLELVAKRYGMLKVMLTCLKANEAAMSFYLKNGFEVDGISPSQDVENGEDDLCDYEIMSKRV